MSGLGLGGNEDDDGYYDGGGGGRNPGRGGGGGGGIDFVSGLRRGMMMDVAEPGRMILPPVTSGGRSSSYDGGDSYYDDGNNNNYARGGGSEDYARGGGGRDDPAEERMRRRRSPSSSSSSGAGQRRGGRRGGGDDDSVYSSEYYYRNDDRGGAYGAGNNNVMMTRRRGGPPRPVVTTEARTSTPMERSSLSGMLPGTRRLSARAARYNDDGSPLVVGSDASLSAPRSSGRGGYNNGVQDQSSSQYYGQRDYSPQQQQQQQQFGSAQQQTSVLSEYLPETQRFSAAAVRYNSNAPAVIGSQQTSMLSEYLPETQRLSAVATRYNTNAPAVIGSDASLSTPKSRGRYDNNGGQDSSSYYGRRQDYQQRPFGSAQQTSMLSEYLPENQRFSAQSVRYNEPPVVGSDASLSPSTPKSRGGYDNNGGQDSSSYYGRRQDYQRQPFGSAQQTSMLSEYLPENQRFSAQSVRYNEPPVVGSDASLSSSTPKSRGGYDDGAGRNFDALLGPKTSPMLDWFSAPTSSPGVSFATNGYGEGNGLSALAGGFQVSRPSSRTNHGGSAIGDFSPSVGLGGSDAAMGGGIGIGRTFDYDTGDPRGPTSDYYPKQQPKVKSVRDTGVKDLPSSMLGSIASASRRPMKEIDRYVYQEDNMSFDGVMPQQGSVEGGYNGYDGRNYGDNADQYSYDANGDYDSYQSGD
jgi:hypothetical protein